MQAVNASRFFSESSPNRQLFDAVDSNNIEKASQLIAKGSVDINHSVNYGDTDYTPLLAHAIRAGHIVMARLLIENGADVNQGNPGDLRAKYDMITPLYCAILLDLTLSAKHLSLHEDISEEDRTSLAGFTELLLEKKANPNKIGDLSDEAPFSGLHYYKDEASPEKVNEIFSLLTRYGGNISGVPERIRDSFCKYFDFTSSQIIPTM